MLIWRPIYAGKVTLSEVKHGTATLGDLLKLNALIDLEAAETMASMPKKDAGK